MTRPMMEELRQRVGSQSNARGQKVIYAGVPSSGPAGETCRTCKHLRNTGTNKPHYKCGLTKYTHGDATTIKVRTAACHLWVKCDCEYCAYVSEKKTGGSILDADPLSPRPRNRA